MGFLTDSYSGLGTDCAREARMSQGSRGERTSRGDASAAAIELVGRGPRRTRPPEWRGGVSGGDGLGGYSSPSMVSERRRRRSSPRRKPSGRGVA